MLVHHADAKRVGVVRVLDLDLFAIFLDNAFFRLIQTEQYAHQGRFAGAVFAQQRMDLAFAQLQRDIVVGLDTGELLGDVQHLDNEIICQSVHAPFYFHSILTYIYYIKKSRIVQEKLRKKRKKVGEGVLIGAAEAAIPQSPAATAPLQGGAFSLSLREGGTQRRKAGYFSRVFP